MKTLSVILTICLFNVLQFNSSEFIKTNNNFQIDQTTIDEQDYYPVRINFYSNTSQQEINDAINTINPINYFRCADDEDVYIVVLPVDETGRGNGSGGNGDTDNVIERIASIQSYRINGMCD